ncbi:MAG: hypothetical protein ISR65_19840 [Bacteriovoracaceae bacterium]|nr:hypothetical protein [Bacteriovoracaceae bacterium]
MRYFLLLFLFVSFNTWASATDQIKAAQVNEENLYFVHLDRFLNHPEQSSSYIDSLNLNLRDERFRKIVIDSLWDLLWKPPTKNFLTPQHIEILEKIKIDLFSLADRVRLFLLAKKFHLSIYDSYKLIADLGNSIDTGTLDRRSLYTLLNHKKFLISHGHDSVYRLLKDRYLKERLTYKAATSPFRAKTKEEFRDLFFNTPDTPAYRNGTYKNGIRLFLICRHSRFYPCIMLLKDHRNRPVYGPDGKTLWNSPSLALGQPGLNFNQRNGHTPSGVYTLDSVMPQANRPRAFGKFRRVIVNFIASSRNEKNMKSFLPPSAHEKPWWSEAVIARDLGRNLFRIHGTGSKNDDDESTFYPFVRTSGCIARREGLYDNIKYIDQRVLLDSLMINLNLEPIYKNEKRISGVLYIIEIDDQKKAVDYEDVDRLLFSN